MRRDRLYPIAGHHRSRAFHSRLKIKNSANAKKKPPKNAKQPNNAVSYLTYGIGIFHDILHLIHIHISRNTRPIVEMLVSWLIKMDI